MLRQACSRRALAISISATIRDVANTAGNVSLGSRGKALANLADD